VVSCCVLVSWLCMVLVALYIKLGQEAFYLTWKWSNIFMLTFVFTVRKTYRQLHESIFLFLLYILQTRSSCNAWSIHSLHEPVFHIHFRWIITNTRTQARAHEHKVATVSQFTWQTSQRTTPPRANHTTAPTRWPAPVPLFTRSHTARLPQERIDRLHLSSCKGCTCS
jgi:hypothetical protein